MQPPAVTVVCSARTPVCVVIWASVLTKVSASSVARSIQDVVFASAVWFGFTAHMLWLQILVEYSGSVLAVVDSPPCEVEGVCVFLITRRVLRLRCA